MNYRDIAERLAIAESDRNPVGQLTADYPDLTIQDAYKIQLEGIAINWPGMQGCRKKNRPDQQGMQKLLGLDEQTTVTCWIICSFWRENVSAGRAYFSKIEGELAFILNDRLRGRA